MNRIFEFFGKFVFLLIIVGVLLGGGIFVGIQLAKKFWPQLVPPTTTAKITPTVIVTPNLSGTVTPAPTNTPTPTITPSPTPTPIPLTQVQGGSSSQTLYTIMTPPGWEQNREHDDNLNTDKLTLTKNGYTVLIYQAPTGGAACWYQGDSAPEGPSVFFKSFVNINGTDGRIYRRGAAEPKNERQGYTICEKKDAFQTPTTFGHITYNAPKNPDETLLKEIDTMIATLKKQ
jgi:hypothetical protein